MTPRIGSGCADALSGEMALTFAVILGLAGVSWRYFERPILALKDRFPYRPTENNGHQGPPGAEALAWAAEARRS